MNNSTTQQRMKSTFEALTAYEANRETFIEQEAYRYVFNRTAEAGFQTFTCPTVQEACTILNTRDEKPAHVEPTPYGGLRIYYGKANLKAATKAATDIYTGRLRPLQEAFEQARAAYLSATEADVLAASEAATRAAAEEAAMQAIMAR